MPSHIGSRYQAEVTFPPLFQPKLVLDPGRMQGCVDLGTAVSLMQPVTKAAYCSGRRDKHDRLR